MQKKRKCEKDYKQVLKETMIKFLEKIFSNMANTPQTPPYNGLNNMSNMNHLTNSYPPLGPIYETVLHHSELVAESSHELQDEDWLLIAGSDLHINMLKNRISVFSRNEGLALDQKVIEQIHAWLKSNVSGFYYVKESRMLMFYFEKDAEAVHFKMYFHEQTIEFEKRVYTQAYITSINAYNQSASLVQMQSLQRQQAVLSNNFSNNFPNGQGI